MKINASAPIKKCIKTLTPRGTYMSLVIQLIVCQFKFVKADHLTHPRLSWGRGVWVDVHSGRHRGVCVPRYHPLGAVVHIPEQFTRTGSVISTVSKMHVCPSAFYHLPWDQVCSVRFEVQFKSMSIIIITDLKHLSCATFLIIDFIIFLCRPRGLSSFDWVPYCRLEVQLSDLRWCFVKNLLPDWATSLMKQWVMRMKEFEMIDLQIMAHRTTAFVCSTTTFVGLTFWAGRGEASKRPFPKGTAKPPWLTVGAKSHLWSEDGVLGWPRNGEVETKATHAIKNDFYRTCMWHLTATYIGNQSVHL